ncbi:D-methionine transport system permease protein [Sedimentibacter acidaminivorans]|uniref:D-methionine transport system permease protein n=1 Tax=Sedimentibacter acidaminivorans TaxID=913099 RepID=A0ABS4G9H1_9FIRM|nr:methionine ABC transporter permease [Sedimentibacter acidaminivorans]MBP1924329.1 D-methionine transport system permease protein [Sedimentibacter acidaminivorans]
MLDLLEKYTPNLLDYSDEFVKSISETLQMLFLSGTYSFIVGLFLGTLLVVTRKGNILENRAVHRILDGVVNLFRSIPFVILITALIPLTKLIVGTFIGVKGTIFPLVVGCTPFFIRQVDMALSDIDNGLIEAAQSMGLSPLGIIFRVYLKESIPALARSTTITTISLLGLTAMGGAVGGGGLGSFVIRYGHNRFYQDITYVSVIVILIFVTIIQFIGNIIIKKTSH